jgi:hypothetical protein
MQDSQGRVVFLGLEPFALPTVQRGAAYGVLGSVTMSLSVLDPSAPEGWVEVTAQMSPEAAVSLASDLYREAQKAINERDSLD